jgi:PAS domain S-box-containing protein
VTDPGPALDLSLLAERAGDPMMVHREGRCIWANAATATLAGVAAPVELIGRRILDFVDEPDRERVAGLMERAYRTGRSNPPFPATLRRADGRTVPVEVVASALDGARFLVVFHDLTERQQAQAAQFVAEQRLRAFFDESAYGMGLARDGRYLLVNPAFARMFGYERPGEITGLPLLDLFAPAERTRIVELGRRRAAGEPIPANYHSRGLRRDGTEFDAELQAFGFREEGAFVTAAIVRDVTDQLAADARLRQSEQRYRELFDLVPVSLWEVDLSVVRTALARLRESGTDLRGQLEQRPELVGELTRAFKVISINRTGFSQVGARSSEELLGALPGLFDADTFPRYRELGLQLIEGKRSGYAEGWSATVTGERRWIATTASVLPGHEQDWKRILFASVDLTDRRRAEEERAALQERLLQAEKLEAVGRLAGGVAHDFNNILSGILGYAELSAMELEPGSDLHEHQQRIREAALRARDLVRQILSFSRRDRSDRRLVDAATVVNEALALMRAGIPSTATLSSRVDPSAGSILADPTQLHQVVLNLCANARDAIGTYGRIEVSVEAVSAGPGDPDLPPGPWVRLRVRDDGVGMDDATRARIFEPFMTTKGPQGGHGLGLAVVHGIVTGAGGRIRIESAPGKGTTFDVYFPRREAEPEPAKAPRAAAAPHGEKILLVDDEPSVLAAHRRLLEGLGYRVETARNGEEALRLYETAPDSFALVFSDQAMPRMAGDDLARAVLALRPTARIVLCTGYSERLDVAGARELGVRALLEKPIDRETLAATLARILAEP